jgi:signal peptidase I
MPSILSDLKILLFISVLIDIICLCLFSFNKNDKINSYNFHKSFYVFYDYFSYFVNSLSIIFMFMISVATPSVVDGNSMETTLSHKDTVLVYHLFYQPEKDDIVVVNATPYRKNWTYYYSTSDTEYYVKRCKAVKGDRIEFREKNVEGIVKYQVYINNIVIDNLYVTLEEKNKILTKNDVVINELNVIESNHILVISDNKNIPTVDSRLMGFIRCEDVIGKVSFRFFPFSKFEKF